MSDKYSDRSRVVKLIFIVVGVLFVGRLAMLQIFDPTYRRLADQQALRNVTQYPARGFIYDRKGRLLVHNEAVYDLMVIPRWAEHVAQPHGGTWQVVNLKSDSYQAELRQRPGSVIPLANLAQSTSEMHTDSLTLLVCPDTAGEAYGQLYEDDGDGFGYREGQYRLSQLKASLDRKKTLTVSVSQTEGKLPAQPRTLRIGYVYGGKVQYSSWQTGDSATMKIKK